MTKYSNGVWLSFAKYKMILVLKYLGKIQAASIESMAQDNEEMEANAMLQGASSSIREEEDAFPENEPRRRRSGKRDNIFHTRYFLRL